MVIAAFTKHSPAFLATFALVTTMASVAFAQNQIVYNSIPKSLPGNVASEGPEAYGFRELGDGMTLAGAPGARIQQVNVVLSSWACVSGTWYDGNCSTPGGSKFSQAITLNVYSVVWNATVPSVGPLLATTTETFQIPYRPSSTPAQCGGSTRWYNSKDKTCYNGLAVPIQFNLSNLQIELPSQVIVGISYNTSHYGPSPIGTSACSATTAGCPYDSLNIGTDGDGGVGVVDTNGIFVNYTIPNTSCSGTAPPTVLGTLAIDTPCWTGYHPLIEIRANQSSKGGKHTSLP